MFDKIDLWLNFAISTILMALQLADQDPLQKAKIKKAILKVYKSIKLIYVDDPDFQ